MLIQFAYSLAPRMSICEPIDIRIKATNEINEYKWLSIYKLFFIVLIIIFFLILFFFVNYIA